MEIIEITSDGCVAERHIGHLRGKPTAAWLVYAAGIEKVKHLVRLSHEARGLILVCPVTGTLYDPITKRSSDRDLYLLRPAEAEEQA
jgi:hypothetical protein